jgi:hypothetical protein
MPAYHLLHWQNPKPGKEGAYAAWLRESRAPALLQEAGLRAIQFLALQAVQLQPPNVQLWRFCTLYEIETSKLEETLSIISESARRRPKELGWLEGDVSHVFELTRLQLNTSNPIDASAPLHLAFVMGNCIAGKEAEYDTWYDEIHAPEVLATPDFVGMRRGRIASSQALPDNDQPANRLVLLQIRSHDLHASIAEFIARANGTSPSGVKWKPREAAAGFASLQRTTHVFTPFSPRLTAGRGAAAGSSSTLGQGG